MPDPTPAPLTDEQMAALRYDIRGIYVVCSPDRDLAEDNFDTWYAANIARRADEADGLRWHDGAIRDRQGRYASLHVVEVA